MSSQNITKNSELLPCPFCGGEAEMHYDANGSKWVACENRECAIQPYLYRTKRTEAEAIAAWNTRYERTCRQEERGWSTEGDHARVWLTCGHDCMVETVQDLPNYCPNCGAKVIA